MNLKAILSIVRVPNCFMIGLAVILAETIALKGSYILEKAIFGFLTGFLLLAASMVVNDYRDIEVDRINNPRRPLPSGEISLVEAQVLAVALSLAGFTSAAAINLEAFLIAAVSILLMVFYNFYAKGTGLPGSMIVAFNVAVPFIFGGYATGHMMLVLWIFALLAFLSALGREITKGIVDVRGDSQKGIGTVAATRGVNFASRLAAAFYLAAVALSLLPVLLRLVSAFYIPLVVVSDAGFLFVSLRIVKDPSKRTALRVKRLVMVWMLLGLLAFLAGSYR